MGGAKRVGPGGRAGVLAGAVMGVVIGVLAGGGCAGTQEAAKLPPPPIAAPDRPLQETAPASPPAAAASPAPARGGGSGSGGADASLVEQRVRAHLAELERARQGGGEGGSGGGAAGAGGVEGGATVQESTREVTRVRVSGRAESGAGAAEVSAPVGGAGSASASVPVAGAGGTSNAASGASVVAAGSGGAGSGGATGGGASGAGSGGTVASGSGATSGATSGGAGGGAAGAVTGGGAASGGSASVQVSEVSGPAASVQGGKAGEGSAGGSGVTAAAGPSTGAAASTVAAASPVGAASSAGGPSPVASGGTAVAVNVTPVTSGLGAVSGGTAVGGTVGGGTVGGGVGGGGGVEQVVAERVARDPRDVSAVLDGQLLGYLKGESGDAGGSSVAGLPAEDREIVSAVIDALVNLRATTKADPNATYTSRVRPLVELSQRLRTRADLSVPVATVCVNPKGYGLYDPVPGVLSSTGVSSLSVYYEVANFTSRYTDRKLWETRLGQQMMLYDSAGRVVWQDPMQTLVDQCRNKRSDFFVLPVVKIPPVAAGRYTLKIVITDLNVGRVAEGAVAMEAR